MALDKTQSQVKARVESDLDRAADAIKKEAEAAKQQLNEGGARLRDAASEAFDKTKEVVSHHAEEGKGAVAASMGDFAAAVRKASDELGERDQSMAATLVRQVAGGLEDASRSLHGSSVGDLTRSVTEFARRQPTTFLLGAALAGVALGRFVKASDERPHIDPAPPVAPGYGRLSTATTNNPSTARSAAPPSVGSTTRRPSSGTTEPETSTISSSGGSYDR